MIVKMAGIKLNIQMELFRPKIIFIKLAQKRLVNQFVSKKNPIGKIVRFARL